MAKNNNLTLDLCRDYRMFLVCYKKHNECAATKLYANWQCIGRPTSDFLYMHLSISDSFATTGRWAIQRATFLDIGNLRLLRTETRFVRLAKDDAAFILLTSFAKTSAECSHEKIELSKTCQKHVCKYQIYILIFFVEGRDFSVDIKTLGVFLERHIILQRALLKPFPT